VTRSGIVIASAVPAMVALAISSVPGLPAGISLGAAIALGLLVVGAICVVIGIGALDAPLAFSNASIMRAMGGSAVAMIVRVGGAITAALILGHDESARAAIATIAVSLMAGTMVETALLLRALRRSAPLGATHA